MIRTFPSPLKCQPGRKNIRSVEKYLHCTLSHWALATHNTCQDNGPTVTRGFRLLAFHWQKCRGWVLYVVVGWSRYVLDKYFIDNVKAFLVLETWGLEFELKTAYFLLLPLPFPFPTFLGSFLVIVFFFPNFLKLSSSSAAASSFLVLYLNIIALNSS